MLINGYCGLGGKITKKIIHMDLQAGKCTVQSVQLSGHGRCLKGHRTISAAPTY